MGRVNIATGNRHRTVPGDPRQCPSVTSRLAQTREECMSEVVEHERTYFAVLDRLAVLLLEAAMVYMTTLWVGAGHVQPSIGFPARAHRSSRVVFTLTVIGRTRRAAEVLPCVTRSVPLRPF